MQITFFNPEYLEYLNFKSKSRYKDSIGNTFELYLDFFKKICKFLNKEERDILYCMEKHKTKRQISRILGIHYKCIWAKINSLLSLIRKYYEFDSKYDLFSYQDFDNDFYVFIIMLSLQRLSVRNCIDKINVHYGFKIGSIKYRSERKKVLNYLWKRDRHWYYFVKGFIR